jgi:muramoyltetrapeptide carboxypeptidase
MTTVGLVAPSCRASDDELREGIAALEGAGFRVKPGARCFADRPHTAAEDVARAEELSAAFADPEVDAVLCVRGGYGVARLLDYLDLGAMAGWTKPFAGFSDLTTLHGILARYAPLVPRAYAPMAASAMIRTRSPRSEQLHRFLRREPLGNILAGLPPEEARVLCHGKVEAPVTGGCLCLVVATLGTPYELDARGKILVLEDIDEESRRVDRYLTQLHHAGKLRDAVGVVAGSTFCRPEEESPMATQEEILRRYFEPLNVPVLLDVPVGHVSELLTVPLGTPAFLDTDAPGGPVLSFGA